MAKSLEAVQADIAKLQKEADVLIKERNRQASVALASIRAAVAFFGFTSEDVFASEPGKAKTAAKASRATKQKAPAAFKDPTTGRTWSGQGRRPNWFVAAIEAGRTEAELRI